MTSKADERIPHEDDQATQAQPDGAADPAAAPAGDAAPPADPLQELQTRLDQALAELAQAKDQHLRARAETENVRRRAQEDVAKAHKFAIEGFAEALLPVKDSLELALKAEHADAAAMREGLEATLRLMASTFEKNRLLEVDPAGQKFDPNLHQAISMVPGNSVEPPVAASHVVTVLQKGYTINDRVLRPALVTVAEG